VLYWPLTNSFFLLGVLGVLMSVPILVKIDQEMWLWEWAQCDKPNPENCKNCSSKCAYDCAQLQYTVQHRTVLIISPLTSRQPSELRCWVLVQSGGEGLSWVEQGLTSHQTHYRSYRGRVFTGQMTQPTVSKHWRKIQN